MGKGTINSHTGEGLYNVTLNLDKTRIITELASLAIMISACETLIATITSEISSLETEIASINPFTQSDLYKLKTQELNQKKNKKNVLILKKASCEARQKYLLNNTPTDPEITAWCADKTTTLSGEVGIIEVPGERKTSVNIQPGYGGNAVYSATRDGQLQPSISGLPSTIFYNWAMLPGWQKWMPTYRYGTITSIDTEADTCNVTLEAATSSVKDDNGVALNVNAVDALEDVPIVYMDVDGEAFAVGDVVLIKFDSVKADIRDAGNWANCTVIGFKDHPKYPEGGALLYTEAWDFDWNQKGFVSLDSALEPVLAIEPAIVYPTASFANIDRSNEYADVVCDSHETPFLYSSQDFGEYTNWTFRMVATEHYTTTTTLSIDANIIKEASFALCLSVIREYEVSGLTEAGPPEVFWTDFYPPSDGYITSVTAGRFIGTKIDLVPTSAGWIDEDHYIYVRMDRAYAGVGDNAVLKTYLIINAAETLLYESNYPDDDGYEYVGTGLIMTALGEYSSTGGAVFQDGINYKYAIVVQFESYDDILGESPFIEIFYSDGTTLTRKTFLSDSGLALLGEIDGTNIYTCGDITIKA
jgi:hypothetical protein